MGAANQHCLAAVEVVDTKEACVSMLHGMPQPAFFHMRSHCFRSCVLPVPDVGFVSRADYLMLQKGLLSTKAEGQRMMKSLGTGATMNPSRSIACMPGKGAHYTTKQKALAAALCHRVGVMQQHMLCRQAGRQQCVHASCVPVHLADAQVLRCVSERLHLVKAHSV